MIHYFCPVCWSELQEDLAVCPKCSLDIPEFLKDKDHTERLILALRHPVPDLREWAASLLGEMRDPRAVAPLMKVVKEEQDIYVVREAIRSLGAIGGPEVWAFLEAVADHPATMVRTEVRQILDSHSEGEGSQSHT